MKVQINITSYATYMHMKLHFSAIAKICPVNYAS